MPSTLVATRPPSPQRHTSMSMFSLTFLSLSICLRLSDGGCLIPMLMRVCISRYIEAYSNPNLTTWVTDYNQTMPKNKYLGQC